MKKALKVCHMQKLEKQVKEMNRRSAKMCSQIWLQHLELNSSKIFSLVSARQWYHTCLYISTFLLLALVKLPQYLLTFLFV